MPAPLPPSPSLENLRKRAKSLCKAHRDRRSECLDVLRALPRLAGLDDEGIFSTQLTLGDVQFALARFHGFESWDKLLHHLSAMPSQPALGLTDGTFGWHLMRDDSLARSLALAAHQLGVQTDDSTVAMLAGNCLVPSFDTGETCTAWWQMSDRGWRLAKAAQDLGLSVRRVGALGERPVPNMPKEDYRRMAGRNAQLLPAALAELAGDDAVLLTEGGWGPGPHGFVPWCVWGLVTAWPAGGPVLGATFNGHSDNPIDYLTDLWVIHRAQEPRTPDRYILPALADASARLATSPQGDAWLWPGMSGVHRWADQMCRVEGFCPECQQQGKGWTCAVATGESVQYGSRLAARQLRRWGQDSPAEDSLVQAARCYERIDQLLAPALAGGTGAHYREFCGDLVAQSRHAREALLPAAGALAQAGEHMREACELLRPGQ